MVFENELNQTNPARLEQRSLKCNLKINLIILEKMELLIQLQKKLAFCRNRNNFHSLNWVCKSLTLQSTLLGNLRLMSNTEKLYISLCNISLKES